MRVFAECFARKSTVRGGYGPGCRRPRGYRLSTVYSPSLLRTDNRFFLLSSLPVRPALAPQPHFTATATATLTPTSSTDCRREGRRRVVLHFIIYTHTSRHTTAGRTAVEDDFFSVIAAFIILLLLYAQFTRRHP